ncbi:hypothetical protein WJX82_001205 [Trebouxia sp. C0006]
MATANTAQQADQLVSTKEPYEEPKVPKKIKQVRFSLMSPGEVVKTGELNVYQGQLFHLADRTPFAGGPLDPHLGISTKQALCQTCGQKLTECTGHFGYIKLELPVFHIGYMKPTLQILQAICKHCSHVLLDADDRRKYLKRMTSPKLERTQKAATFKAVGDKCKRCKLCPWCGSVNGTVKKATGSLKYFHDKYNSKTQFAEHQKYVETFEEAMQYNEQIRPHVNKVADDLSPLRVLALFSAITAEDCILLDVADRPEYLIMTHIPVPPVCIRPSVEMDSGQGSNEDDLTVRLRDIILYNNGVRVDLEKGAGIEQVMEHWDMLQVNCAAFINSDLPGLPPNHSAVPSKPTRGFVQRLKGKQGRFRGNLSGKRVDFSGRTVISPDPNLRVDEVCVPKLVAQILTFPDCVTDHNIEKLRQCVLNGVACWPGANHINMLEGGRWFLKFGDRRKLAAELKVGDVVERHLMDGDIALFNRQPSLHRMSIMAHRVRVMPWRTFRFNECVCSPYNADFDGDEMNLHVPQTQEAKTEASELMGVMNNLCTPKNGEILIAATQDFLTSAFLVTSKDCFYSRSEFGLLCTYMGDAAESYDLPVPTIVKPVELWTGKQIFSAMVRPNAATRVYVNLETKEKMYSGGDVEHMCPKDGYVCFRNSQLLCGRLGKATLGGGNKAGLFQVLNTDYSALVAASCMNRLAKLSARFIGNRGFSIGIDDVTPAPRLVEKKQQTVSTGYAKVQEYIKDFSKGRLKLESGCDSEQSLEKVVTDALNDVREKAAKVCMDTLHWHNSPLNMSQCGSKGSPINIAQMVACVGQQSVGGKRAPNGFKDRSLPHFPRGDKTPEGKGFVASSFYTGLSATEFFFHTMGGREGLVDTAVKTAETGYMSRRLMKSLEDLYTHYDGTVRNSASGIVQLTYGDDGLDPVSMEGKDGTPIDFVRTLSQIKASTPNEAAPGVALAAAAAPLPGELVQLLEQRLQLRGLVEGSDKYSGLFIASLKEFILKQVTRLKGVRERLGLPAEERGAEEVEVAAGVHGLSQIELDAFVDLTVQRYQTKRMDPGSTVGAFGAQSIGEPGTQMTLKTFHFAGVASMNVTLGVPRIKEIINAAKNISTPIITAELSVDNNETSARMVKARLEKTVLGQVTAHIKAVLQPAAGFISIRLDLEVIAKLQLSVTPHSVGTALLKQSKLKLKTDNIRVSGGDSVEIHPAKAAGKSILITLQLLLQQVPQVIVQGIPAVDRAVVNKDEKTGKYKVFVEGHDMQRVMGTVGVLGLETTSNDIMEVWKYLGVEAARKCIMSEIHKTMSSHGMSIDARHTMLLADCMTSKGEVLGITRFGIAKMKDSVLMLASFEKTTDHLFDAALHGRVDDITGVSESIIMGIPMPVGTGLFKIQHQSQVMLPPPRPLPILAC